MKKSSIRKKLLISMMGLLSILLLFLIVFEIEANKKLYQEGLNRRIELMRKSMNKRGKVISSQIAVYTENAIASYNFFNISRIMEDMVKENENLEYGILVDNSGMVHVHTKDHNLIETRLDSESDKFILQQTELIVQKTEKNGVSYLEFITPISIGNNPWGFLRLGFSLATLDAEIHDSRLSMEQHLKGEILQMVGVFLFCILVGSFLIVDIAKRITGPLQQLTEFSTHLAKGNFNAKVPIEAQKANDETGVLSRAFVEMAAKLTESRTKLEDYSHSLEQEIIERKRAEEKLKESYGRLQDIMDHSPAVIYLKDVHGRYILINRQYETLFRINKEKIIGRTDKDIFSAEKAEAFQHNDQKVIEKGSSLEFEEYVPHDDGIRTYISIKFPLFDFNGEIYGICGISTDITERKKAETAQKQFSKKLVESQEQERKRIAAELHDSLAQNMMVINNEAHRIMKKYSEKPKDLDSWKLISSVALESVDEIRRISYKLRPSELDQFGLKDAVQSLIEKISRTSGIEIHKKFDSVEGSISSVLEIQVYRIIQEGLNNVVKHSLASEAMVDIKSSNKHMHIEISDDGKGFESHVNHEKGAVTEGFGLRGISERAKMFGGSLKIESTIGKGTSLKVTIPLQ